MKFLLVVKAIRNVLGILTDLLIKGREAGFWEERNQIEFDKIAEVQSLRTKFDA